MIRGLRFDSARRAGERASGIHAQSWQHHIVKHDKPHQNQDTQDVLHKTLPVCITPRQQRRPARHLVNTSRSRPVPPCRPGPRRLPSEPPHCRWGTHTNDAVSWKYSTP